MLAHLGTGFWQLLLCPQPVNQSVDESVEVLGGFLHGSDVCEDAVQGGADERLCDCFQVGVGPDIGGFGTGTQSAQQGVMMRSGELAVESFAIDRIVRGGDR
jgi:hypothetical protein